MNVFITSSPFVPDSRHAELSNLNGFVDRIREALVPCPRYLFIEADPERHELSCQFATDIITTFAQEGIYFSSFQILDGETAEFAQELISESDFIVLSGGHVPTQNAFFQAIGLRDLLEDFDGTILSISAGSMNSADIVYVQPEEEGESAPEFARFAPGLGLTAVNILPHYQKVKDNLLDGLRLFEDITYADSMDHEFFALPDGSYFLQDEEDLVLFGEAYRLRDGVLEQICKTGAFLDMTQLED